MSDKANPINLDVIPIFLDCERRGAFLHSRLGKILPRPEMNALGLLIMLVYHNLEYPGEKHPDMPETVNWTPSIPNLEVLDKQVQKITDWVTLQAVHYQEAKYCHFFEEWNGIIGNASAMFRDAMENYIHIAFNFGNSPPNNHMAQTLCVMNAIMRSKLHMTPDKQLTHYLWTMPLGQILTMHEPKVHRFTLRELNPQNINLRPVFERITDVLYNGAPAMPNPSSVRCSTCILNNDAQCPERAKAPTLSSDKNHEHFSFHGTS